MGLTSQHFSESELACHHCQLNGVVQEILDALEAFRLLVGSHVLLDSAYRCPVWNRLEGGARHVQGGRFVARRDQPDSVVSQVRVEPEVAAVDDAEYDIDAFGLQHAGEHFAASRGVHGASAVSPGRGET